MTNNTLSFDEFVISSTPLHNVAHLGQLDVVDMLIEAGADVNAVMASGDTPLHMAAYTMRLRRSSRRRIYSTAPRGTRRGSRRRYDPIARRSRGSG